MNLPNKHYLNLRTCLTLALCSVLSSVLLASDSSDTKIYQLDSLVITGNPLATPISKIPGSVSVIDKKTIEKNTNLKITDTIKKLSGVRVSNDAGFIPRPSIKLRGMNYGTLLMLDGMILSDSEGGYRITNQISLYDVERVEVARGAFSSLYGTNAIGGVVNFITSMPNKLEINTIVGYGNGFNESMAEKDLIKMYFSLGDALLDKKLRYKLSFGGTHSDGYRSVPAWTSSKPTDAQGGYFDKGGNFIIGDAGRRQWRTIDARAKIEYDIDDSSMIKAVFSISNHNYEFVSPWSLLKKNGNPTFIARYNGTNGNSSGDGVDNFVGTGYAGLGTYTHFVGGLGYLKDFENSNLRINLSTLNLISWWQDGSKGASLAGGPGISQDINTSANYLDIIYSYDISGNNTVNSGLQFRYLQADQLNRTPTNWRDRKTVGRANSGYGGMTFVASGYVDWNALWSKYLSTTLGARYDYWLEFAGYTFGGLIKGGSSSNKIANTHLNNISPKLSLNYHPLDQLIFKGSIGTGFRMPTYRERYRISFGQEYAINPDLKPETGLSWEVGMEWASEVFFSLYYYQIDLYNMIYREGTGSNGSPYKQVNSGFGRINGVETQFTIALFNSLKLELNYTLTLATILENKTSPKVVGNQLADTPKHMGNITLSYGQKDGIYGSMWAHATDSFYNSDKNSPPLYNTFLNYDAQFSLNGKIGYVFLNGFDLSFSILNMTNNRYYDQYITPGISYFAELRYKLK